MVDPRRDESYDKTEWRTPIKVFRRIEEFTGRKFTLDPCTTEDNPLKTPKFFTKKEDGLKQSWEKETVYCNPPFGKDIDRWVYKAYESAKYDGAFVVMLLPNFTDTSIFHRIIVKYADVVFIEGRIRFVGARGSPREGSILAIFSNTFHSKQLTLNLRGLT